MNSPSKIGGGVPPHALLKRGGQPQPPMLEKLGAFIRGLSEGHWFKQPYVLDYLKLRSLIPEQKSLHIGNDFCFLPFAEALFGLKVLVTDFSGDTLFLLRAAHAKFRGEVLSELQPEVQPVLKIEDLDVVAMQDKFAEGEFDHIVMQNIFNDQGFQERLQVKGLSLKQIADATISEITRIAKDRATLTLTDEFPLWSAIRNFPGRAKFEVVAKNLQTRYSSQRNGIIFRILK